ncbi:MotE family protein [Thermosulfurimonas dismutans]|uniref:Flagellar protein FlbB n=1 Tax=Thermosulfurimonas dismutans TaxID=999894 RepID=A0A179D5I1_9BACT|nr:hypothetical protein [Thermosulfurimonas dismutans]OAQ20712.1 Flagellar protein FlbB [Thermosulfurimonas dismutans]
MKLSRLMSLLLIVGILKFSLAGLFMILKVESGFTEALAEEKTSSQTSCPPELFEGLKIERKKLEERRKEIELQEKRLKLLEKQIERRLTALLELENSLEEKLEKIRTIETERFKLLVKAYSEMRPSKAAGLLVNMDPEMAVRILSAMKSDQVARILAAMPPQKAASLAEALSGYAPKEF